MSGVKRSKSGCWTCRLRRKKCNEGGPPCTNCETRKVFCHGYGPRPAWKDKGDKEREEANRLQHQARMCRRGSSAAANNTGHSHSSSTESSSASASGLCTAVAELESPLLTDFEFPLSPTLEFANFEFHGNLGAVPSSASTTLLPGDMWAGPGSSSATNLLELDHFRNTPAATDLGVQCLQFPSYTNGAFPDSSPPEKEIELVMHFIGDACSLHMRSHQPPMAQKGWLLFLLMKSPTFYYTSLCIAAHSQSLGFSGDSEARSSAAEDYQKYRSYALRSYHSMVEGASCSIPGEKLICGVQIAHMEARPPYIEELKPQYFADAPYQALGRNMQDCQSYLATAAGLLLSQEEPLATSNAVSATQPCATSRLPTPTPSSPVLSSQMATTALSFYRALLMWNDVLSSSVQRRVPVAADAYRKLLADDMFSASFRDTTGCEGWVLLAILDSTVLDVWRHDQDARGTLSIRALVGQANRIERMVEDRIEELMEPPQTRVLDPALAPAKPDISPNNIYSYILGHSVLVDIHTIVSGPKAGVPETSESIDRAISAWKLLPPSLRPQMLAWAYCVSASLATGEKREFFRDLMIQLSRDDGALGGLHDVKCVVEKCWGAADERTPARDACHDWKDIMQRSKLNILFA